MQKLLTILSICGLFALSSMSFYPMSDTFAKREKPNRNGPIDMDEVEAPDVIFFEGGTGTLNFSATIENNEDNERYIYVRAEVTGPGLTEPYALFWDYGGELPAHDLGPITVFWSEAAPQVLEEGVYTVTAFVCDDPNACNSTTNLISVSALFEVEILNLGAEMEGGGGEGAHVGEGGAEG